MSIPRPIALLAALLFLGTGCFLLPSPEERLCGRVVDCAGGSRYDVDSCVLNTEDSLWSIEGQGCLERYDLMMSCYLSEGTCVDAVYEAPACDGVAMDYAMCMGF